MKNTALNQLHYTGIVTLSQYNGEEKLELKKVHNAGGNGLFNFLADCLIGDFDIASMTIPSKIMLLTYNDNKELEKASGFIYKMSKPEKLYTDATGESTVRYSFQITRDVLEGARFDGIGLYTKNTSEIDCQKYAAFCNITHKDINLSASSVLVVDWELTISNT